MGLPTDYWPREGDVLIVRATVKYDVDPGEEDVHILVGSNTYTPVRIPLADVTGVHCRRWEVKDRVRVMDGSIGLLGVDATVIGTHGEWAWVKLDGDHPHEAPTSVHANQLGPIVPPAEPPPLAPEPVKLGDSFNVISDGLGTRHVPLDDSAPPETA